MRRERSTYLCLVMCSNFLSTEQALDLFCQFAFLCFVFFSHRLLDHVAATHGGLPSRASQAFGPDVPFGGFPFWQRR